MAGKVSIVDFQVVENVNDGDAGVATMNRIKRAARIVGPTAFNIQVVTSVIAEIFRLIAASVTGVCIVLSFLKCRVQEVLGFVVRWCGLRTAVHTAFWINDNIPQIIHLVVRLICLQRVI